MPELKLALIEDADVDIKACIESIKVYQSKSASQKTIELVVLKTPDEARTGINNTFDGSIIDLKLGSEEGAGTQIIRDIIQRYRIPVVVLTGTPDNFDTTGIPDGLIKVFKKGEMRYEEIFDHFFKIYNTGITRILGGRGIIEETMTRAFWDSILPGIDGWKNHVDAGRDTEKSLLRFVINHLQDLLDEDAFCFPEEMYITSTNSGCTKTGQIIKDADKYYIVLSPACDLALRSDGSPKTDRVLICAIDPSRPITSRYMKAINKQRPDGSDQDKLKAYEEKKSEAEDKLRKLFSNSDCYYYHYLPKTSLFDGGFINFRNITTHTPEEIRTKFETTQYQISMSFTKDIISRFASYYARQGQPDFDFQMLLERMNS